MTALRTTFFAVLCTLPWSPLLVGRLAAQTPAVPVQVSATIGGVTSPLAENSSITLTANAVGRDVLATLTVRNTSSAAISLNTLSLIGSGDFTVALSPTFPAAVPAGSATNFTIRFLPSNGNRQLSQGTLVYTEGTQTRLFVFNLIGLSPDFAITSIVQPDGNLQALPNGGTVSFPATNPGSSRSALVTITNFGSAPGVLQSAAVAGQDFTLTNFPVFPYTIPVGQETRLAITFTPRLRGTSTGTMTMTLADRSFFFALQGIGASPTSQADFNVTYFIEPDGVPTPLQNGGRILFATTPVNTPRRATLVITNRGPAAGAVNGASLTGGNFAISGTFFPTPLNPNQELRLTITFLAQTRGTSFGTLSLTLNDTVNSYSLEALATVSNIAIAYALATDGNARNLGENGRIVFNPTAVSGASIAEIGIVNQGTGPATLNGVILSGADYQLQSLPLLPATIEAGRSLTFRIRFSPRQTGTSTGSLKIDFSDRGFSFAIEGTTASPDLLLRYVEPRTSNLLTIVNNGVISVPNTPVDSTQSVVVLIGNRGEGPGTVNRISLNGANFQSMAFELAELPTFPVTIDPGRELRFSIRFTPAQAQRFVSSLIIDAGDRSVNATLEGTGVAPLLAYDLITDQGTTTIAPGSPIPVRDTPVGQSTSFQIRVRNAGQLETQISSLVVVGNGFTLPDPLIVPFRLPPDGSQRFTVTFTPQQPGPVTGRLRIGNELFELLANGLGPALRFSFTNAAGNTTLPETGNGVVVFNPVSVGDRTRVQFTITNNGTQSASIASINLASPSPVFAIEGLPALPLTLEAGGSATITLVFTPNAAGTLNATLRVNTTAFTLSGVGNPPAALPAYSFDGPSGVQAPLQQPAIGLTLASPYPLPLRGTLTLTFVSEVFGSNPAVQFAVGGRTVNFTIPAGATRALFDNNAASVRVQTGTVAGNIVITPAFATQAGLDLTPGTPQSLTMTVQRLAPRILDAAVGSRTANSFSLVLTGYSTTRLIRSMQVQLAPIAGQTIANSSFTVNLDSASLVWFESQASQAFGGLFTLTIPFTFAGEANQDLVSRIQSITVTLTNDVGVSNSVTASPAGGGQ